MKAKSFHCLKFKVRTNNERTKLKKPKDKKNLWKLEKMYLWKDRIKNKNRNRKANIQYQKNEHIGLEKRTYRIKNEPIGLEKRTWNF